MPRSLTLIAAALAGALALGCTGVGEPASRESQDDADGGTPSEHPWPYAGPCTTVGPFIDRGQGMLTMPGAAPGSVVDFLVGWGPLLENDPTIWHMGAYAVGFPDELRGKERALGVGVNADLATCVHCLVLDAGCDAIGQMCQRGPYFPRSGRASVTQMSDAPGAAFAMELGWVELVPVAIDAALHITPAADDAECFYLERIVVTGRTQTMDTCAGGNHCELAADAGNRRPD
jgi:hypothetical protein